MNKKVKVIRKESPAQEAFDKDIAAAEKARDEAVAPILEAYDKAIAPARKE